MMKSLNIKLKHAYDPVESADGIRILVERLWPRGLSKDRAHLDDWCKDIAPSTELRKWYNHKVELWPSFRKKYIEELEGKADAVSELHHKCQGKTVTFVFAAHDEAHNSAVVLKEFMELPVKSHSAP
jgi:uncharacterized protein YeaO (DUF488 family)